MNLTLLKGLNLMEKIENEICVCCDKPILLEDFENSLSIKEYTLSGLCQKCQNEVFDEK